MADKDKGAGGGVDRIAVVGGIAGVRVVDEEEAE